MIFFINLLRFLAMALITNSHYTGVYPTDLIANGGLLGDVIFFAVSGFCLSNIKLPFHKWYFKRILRIYPIIWIITLFYFAIGAYTYECGWAFAREMLLPTGYHFVTSIMLLYIPYYIFAYADKKLGGKVKGKVDFTVLVFSAVFVAWGIIYLFFYDKSYYHIDTVREPMIRFLYFEAMLIGHYFKKHLDCFENKKGVLKWLVTAAMLAVYFASKMLFSKRASLSAYQIVNQYILLILLACVFACVASLSKKLDGMPEWIKSVVSYLAGITLEIYVVQVVIINAFRGLPFPLNWLVITAVIVAAASVLHFIIKLPSIISRQMKKKEQTTD